MAEDAFVGIDVCFAKQKRLPVVVCKREGPRVVPLMLRDFRAVQPPQGRGNKLALDEATVRTFAEQTLTYLRSLEREHDLRIKRIAIDSPRRFKTEGLARRAAEIAMDQRKISCFATPSQTEFEAIRKKAAEHFNIGGAENRIPHANQLWMLVGFELFRILELHYNCIEVFPQAIAATLKASKVRKFLEEGLTAQLLAVSKLTGWPGEDGIDALQNIGFGSRHDQLDAYMSAWVASLSEKERIACGEPPFEVIWIPQGNDRPFS